MNDEAHEATPNHELERQIMSYNEAKNEREWWAMHEIERLREALREISTRNFPEGTATLELRKIARAALGEGKE